MIFLENQFFNRTVKTQFFRQGGQTVGPFNGKFDIFQQFDENLFLLVIFFENYKFSMNVLENCNLSSKEAKQ